MPQCPTFVDLSWFCSAEAGGLPALEPLVPHHASTSVQNLKHTDSWEHKRLQANPMPVFGRFPKGTKYPIFKDSGVQKPLRAWFLGPGTLNSGYLDPLGQGLHGGPTSKGGIGIGLAGTRRYLWLQFPTALGIG